MNYENHLKLFRDRVFTDGRQTILNSGGAESRWIMTDSAGAYLRNEKGWLRYEASPLAGTYPAADIPGIEGALKGVAERKPKRVFIAYTDHGGSDGMAVWHEGTLSYPRERELEAQAAQGGVLMKYIEFCHGGASLADPKREVPATSAGLLQHFEKHFPPNVCGLATAHEYEVAQTSGDPKPFNQFFDTHPHPTLQDLRDFHRGNESGMISAPVLTSDYFMRDVVQFYCRQVEANTWAKSIAELGKLSSCKEAAPSWLEGMVGALGSKLCDDGNYQKERRAAVDELGVVEMAEAELSWIKSDWRDEHLNLRDPNFKKSYTATLKEIEALEAKKAVLDPASNEALQLQDQIVAARTGKVLNWEIVSNTYANGLSPRFNAYYPGCVTADYMEKKKATYPHTIAAMKQVGLAAALSETRATSLTNRRYEIQKGLRGKTAQFYDDRRKLGEALLHDPRFKSIKEAYDKIRVCENTPIH